MRTRSEAVDQTAPAHRVMALFGGLSEFARAIDVPVTTAHRWLKNGLIPADRQKEVIEAARSLGLPLDPISFVPLPENSTEGLPA